MTAGLKIALTLPVDVREADSGGASYVSACPPLNVFSQGETEEAASPTWPRRCSCSSSPVLGGERWRRCSRTAA